MSNLKRFGGEDSGEKAGSGPTWKVTHTAVSRLQRVFMKLGLDEAHTALHQASESEIQAAFARYLHKAENHSELGISESNFNPSALPSISFSEVGKPKAAENRSPFLEPYFDTLSIAEMSLMMEKNAALDEAPLDEEDFLGCRFFFRFVAEAVEKGCRVVLMQDEKQNVAVMVHVKALRKLKGTALLQVEYNCVTKTDRYKMESIVVLQELLKDAQAARIVGTEHQIHFVSQVLQAHERLLDKTVVSKHDEAWHPRQKCIRPSFIVPLSPITADTEFSALQELKMDATPASERAPSDANNEQPVLHSCAVCDRKSAKLKICSACKSVKYCSRDCQVSHWPSHKKSCKAAAPPKQTKPLPSGASILLNPKGSMGFPFQSIINVHDPIGSMTKSKQAKVNHMPDHEEGEIYVVKVQAGPGNCLIYDRQRSFTTMATDPREHSALMSAIASVNHRSGPKAYLYAKNEGNRFRVYLEDFPQQYVNW